MIPVPQRARFERFSGVKIGQ